MGISELHGLYAVVVDAAVLGGITQLNVAGGSEVRGEPSSDEVYPRIQTVTAQKPSASFTTRAIAAALDLIALTGTDIDGLTAGLSLYAQKHADGGTRAGATSHRKHVINDGLIVPRTLSCDHQGDATLSYDVLITYDGSNDPIVLSVDQSLPAGVTDDERFTIGPVTLESVSFDHIRSFQLDFGIDAVTEGADSDVWDTFCHIRSIQPVLTLSGIDLAWFAAAAIPLGGLAVTHANTAFYLRKRASGGTFVIDATAEHIKFTADGIATIENILDASGDDTGQASLTLPLRYDGTNAPLVINTTSPIT